MEIRHKNFTIKYKTDGDRAIDRLIEIMQSWSENQRLEFINNLKKANKRGRNEINNKL